MADQAQARMLSAAFPTPPPYYKHFTKQNVTKVRQIRKEAATNTNQVDVESLPAELRYLIPPEPPADGRYKSFGAQHDLAQPAQSLAQAGIQELYPADAAHLDPTPHLQTLTRAVLLNFLELVGTLSVNPTQGPEKVEHLQTLFYNLHDLINRYRPHQARESLIMTMEDQLDKIKTQIKGVNAAKDRMQQVLGDIRSNAISDSIETPTKQEKPAEAEAFRTTDSIHKAMYEAMEHDLDD
ncbi:MED7-domain-containing protein, partial [Aureobasidium melanogenum]|uniref:Mediator of RNA polymerase II transcription subunit 7 n=1 Tax=Aureobasidium melanogenum (strain CBS 110374) TaxID=1043003 RepID=A0A074VL47_AURM1